MRGTRLEDCMDHQIKQLFLWQDHMTGGRLSPEDLADSLSALSLKGLPTHLEAGLRKYRKKNRKARLSLVELYVFEQTTFILA